MKWKIFIVVLLVTFLVGGYFLGRPLLREEGPQESSGTPPYTDLAARSSSVKPLSPAEPGAELKASAEVQELTDLSQPFYPDVNSRIIKSAALELRVEKGKVRDAQEKVRLIAESKGGFVQSSQLSAGSRESEAYVMILVPVGEFNSALKELESVGEVLSSQVSGKDVSQEYHDLELDLVHWETERQAVLALLKKANTIDEIIKVRQFLEPIDRQINQIKGRLQFLKSRSDYSQIEVTLSEDVKGEPPSSSIWNKIWGIFLDSLTGLLAFLAAAIPFLILATLLAFLVWLIIKGIRGKRPLAPPPHE